MVSYHDLYLNTRLALRDMGVEEAHLEAQELLCAASEKTKEELLRDLSLYAADKVVEKTAELLERRRNGEPLAYLLGAWEFCGETFLVSPDVLIPRVDTEVLAGRAFERLSQISSRARVLDLCAGTGCLGISIVLRAPNVHGVLVDISPAALNLCRQNVRRHNLMPRALCFPGDALGQPSPTLGHFDMLVCNPPYIPSEEIPILDPSVRDYEPHLALDGGEDGLRFFRAVTENWSRVLKPGGILLYEVGAGESEAVAELLRQAGYEDIQITPDTAGIPRVVEGRKGQEEETGEEP